jgi:hypothetical protein
VVGVDLGGSRMGLLGHVTGEGDLSENLLEFDEKDTHTLMWLAK